MNLKKMATILSLFLLPFLCGCEFNGTQMETYTVTISQNEWKSNDDSDGRYVYCAVSFPEITNRILTEGAVTAYLIDSEGRDNQLPYSRPYQGERTKYIETIRFDYNVGVLTIIVEDSDFVLPNPSTFPNYTFKICIMEP